jgi:hypothetical protein
MSFGGVDEKKLAEEAAKQLQPIIRKTMIDALSGIHDVLDEVLASHKITITIERKDQ